MKIKKRGNIPVTLLVVVLIAMIGFKDFGVFVTNYSVNGKQFTAGERAEVVREEANNFIVKDQNVEYHVPKSNMIKNEKSSDQVYEAVKETRLTGTAGQPLRWIRVGEKVNLVRLENTRGLFKTSEGLEGFINLSDLKTSTVESATPAVSRVDKTLKNEKGQEYKVKRGSQLKVVGFKDGKYTVIDESGNRFLINEKEIKLRGKIEQATRGNNTKQVSASNDVTARVVDEAHKQLGKPYISGDTGKRGFDCSGLTYAVYLNAANIKLPRTSRAQASAGTYVSKANLEPGDLVFFNTSGRGIGHVGIYIGGRNMIHASSGQRKMIIASIDNPYFAPRYVTARRIVN